MEEKNIADEVLGDAQELPASELYSAEFKTRFRGYDKQRVRGFLARVADAYESLQREVVQLRNENRDLRDQMSEYRAMEKSLTEALAGAQALGETTIAQAKREAEVILEEARVIRSEAEAKGAAMPAELREEIASLRSKRARLKADLRAVLDIHLGLLNDTGQDGGAPVEFMPGDRRYATPEASNTERGQDKNTEGESI